MTCRQVSTYNGSPATSGSYATEADCLNACKEGACCEGTTCSVTPQCQCQGTGQVFKGVGTTCSPNPCVVACPCPSGTQDTGAMPKSIHVSVSISGECYSVLNTYPIDPSIYNEQLDCAEGISLAQSYTLARTSAESGASGYVYYGPATPSSNSLMAYIFMTTSAGRIRDPSIGGYLDAPSCYFYLSVAFPVQPPLLAPAGRRINGQISRANFYGPISGVGKRGEFCMGSGSGSGVSVEPGWDVTPDRTASDAYLDRSISGSFSIIGAE